VDPYRATLATSFGPVAGVYERARPEYAAVAVEWVLSEAPGRRVVDLAAGTGKLTRALLAAGAEVTAVEPSAEMRAEFARVLPGVAILAGTAESIPVPDASVDAVAVGSAFHWFDVPAALDEIARVLRPGGVLGVLWNLRDEAEPWVLELSRVLTFPVGSIAGPVEERVWQIGQNQVFGPAELRRIPNPQPFDAARLVGWAASTSRVAVLPAAERERRLAAVAELARTHPALAGRETFDLPYQTVAIRATARA
jgi:SAM-dependent methyltransferase